MSRPSDRSTDVRPRQGDDVLMGYLGCRDLSPEQHTMGWMAWKSYMLAFQPKQRWGLGDSRKKGV